MGAFGVAAMSRSTFWNSPFGEVLQARVFILNNVGSSPARPQRMLLTSCPILSSPQPCKKPDRCVSLKSLNVL